jgi:CrcB protein
MMNETVTLLRNGKIACFIGYALASIVVPVMAVACGYWLA